MENDTEESHLHPEDEGGPTKTFLEHLEDLRWVLMKVVAVVGIAFMICLCAAPTLVEILTRPLITAAKREVSHEGSVAFYIGTNRLGSFIVETNSPVLTGTNRHVAFTMAPVMVGTNIVLGLKELPEESIETAAKNRYKLLNLGPAAAFFLAVQMAIYGGIALSSPFLFYFIGQFIFPALRLKEKKYTYQGMFFGVGLFLLGVSFCYFILMPVALSASAGYSRWMGFEATQWRAEEYISFVSKFILGMGLGFELPVVLLVLVKIGILDYATLAKMRKYMIVINLILGAVLTTPEVVTQILMAVPLQILYEISVWIAWYWERKERKKNKDVVLK